MTVETVEIARGPFRAELLTAGASLRRLEVPGRGGVANVVLGHRDLDDYLGESRYFGAVVGRVANRIGGARFALDGVEYRMPANDGANNLHSGPHGLDRQIWTVAARDAESVTFAYRSAAGSSGFPGNLEVRAHYALDDSGLAIRLTAATDAPTIVNLTHHAYFNLAGEASGETILEHWLRIPASRVTPTDAGMIPTGGYADVGSTPFDFRAPKPIGRDIDTDDAQLRFGKGYDHNFVLDDIPGALRPVATLHHPGSGRVLDLHSTEPGLQFYSGNHLAGGPMGTSGGPYAARGGLCLEPQKFPDSPNRPHFPSTRLDPGEIYRHDIALRFRMADSIEAAFAL